MKMIRIKLCPPPGSFVKPTGEEKWVKETNPFFNWYKKSKVWKVIEEKEVKENERR